MRVIFVVFLLSCMCCYGEECETISGQEGIDNGMDFAGITPIDYFRAVSWNNNFAFKLNVTTEELSSNPALVTAEQLLKGWLPLSAAGDVQLQLPTGREILCMLGAPFVGLSFPVVIVTNSLWTFNDNNNCYDHADGLDRARGNMECSVVMLKEKKTILFSLVPP